MVPKVGARTLSAVLSGQADRRPDSTFLVDEDRSLTYAQVVTATATLADELRRLAPGVGPGSRVTICATNSLEMLLAVFAVAHRGAAAVLVNPEIRGEQLGYILGDAGSTLTLCDEDVRAGVVAAGPRDATVVSLPAAASTSPLPGVDDLVAGRSRLTAESPAQAWDPALVMYTSGTTGRPKGVVLTHAHAVTLGAALADPMELRSDDRFYVFLPLFHAMALCTSVLGAALVGGSAAVVERFSASRFWELARRLEVTVFCSVASALEILARQEASGDDAAHRVRAAYSVPLPQDPHGFEARFGIPLATGYAMTETPPVANGRIRESYDARTDVGEVRGEFVQVGIVDQHDLALPENELGEIVVRPTLPWTGAAEYMNRPQDTVAAHRNLWFHTGDLGRLVAGRLHFEGRRREAIRRRGEFVSPTDVEAALAAMPQVREVSAFAVPSELGEDEVAVAVVPRGDSAGLPEQVHAFAQDTLPPFMVPRYVALVADLPMTSTGKVERMRLSREVGARLAQTWDAEQHARRDHGDTPRSPSERTEESGT